MTMKIYQDALGNWIVFDGKKKNQFGTDIQAANQFYRGLKMTSAINEFQTTMEAVGQQVEAMLPLVDKANDLYAVNQLQELLDSTAEGGLVGDSDLTKEALAIYVVLLAKFVEFANEPLDGINLTPKQIVRLRGK